MIPSINVAQQAREFFRDLMLKIPRLRSGRHARRNQPAYRGGSMQRQVQHRADRRGIRGVSGAPLMWRP